VATMDRRQFIGTTVGLACLGGEDFSVAGEDKPYTRASADWLAKCRYGVGVHWTARWPRRRWSSCSDLGLHLERRHPHS
jgi:hypothetical protein